MKFLLVGKYPPLTLPVKGEGREGKYWHMTYWFSYLSELDGTLWIEVWSLFPSLRKLSLITWTMYSSNGLLTVFPPESSYSLCKYSFTSPVIYICLHSILILPFACPILLVCISPSFVWLSYLRQSSKRVK